MACSEGQPTDRTPGICLTLSHSVSLSPVKPLLAETNLVFYDIDGSHAVLSFSGSLPLYVCLSIYLFVHLSVRPCVYLSVRLSIYPSICPFIYPSVHLSIHPSQLATCRFCSTPAQTSIFQPTTAELRSVLSLLPICILLHTAAAK